MKILLVEDDPKALDYARDGLQEQGHVVECVGNGTEALKLAAMNDFDAVVIDRMLPGLDGLSVVKALREAECSAPIILVTAMGGIADRIEGLDGGADDYLVKPFHVGELCARLHALERRAKPQSEKSILRVGDLEFNLISRLVTRGGVLIELQPRELKLLEIFMRNTDQIITKQMLLKEVWNFNFDPKTTVVETHLSRLRSKIDGAGQPPMICNIRGLGYKIHAP